MTTEQTVQPPKDFIRAKLPWIIAGGFLLLYFFTLNPWLSIQSLPSVAKAGGWDWREAFSGPLFYLITLPVRLLPLSWHPHALNVFSVICAALTLGLLTRSVSLLPHDRTREQRQRERSDFSLLTLPTAWLPPLLAAIVFGLQLTVWQHATVASEEILNLLLFAYIIRCLLEYRVGERESWLYRMAFVYGLAITNNFAMIGFFPLFLAALIWIRGRAFFNLRFLVRSCLLGIAGLSLYLLLPLIHAASADSGLSFWDALRSNWHLQRMALGFGLSQRFLILMAALTSILPVFIIGIRWPSSFGDISAAGSMLTTLMFRVIHLMFLAVCLYIFFDPPISGRGVGLPYMPMLTFYYLAALAVGYFSGYALLVYGKPPAKAWQRPSPAIQLLNRAVIGLVFLSAIGVIAGLAYRNLPLLRAENSDLLRQYTWLMRDSLPDTPAIILSDNPYQLYLLQASLGGASSQNDHLLVDSSSLQNPHYQQHLHSTRPERWSVPLQAAPNAARIEQLVVLTNMIRLASSNDLYYVHPSFGYFFEYFRLEPRGGVYRMRTFETNSILAPPPDPALIETNQQFWAAAREPMERTLSHLGLESIDAGWLGTNFSRSLNFWGVELQRANQIEEAATCFQLASRLNTNNVVAHINRDYNANLQRGSTAPINPDASLENKFSRFRTWESVLAVNGPFDEPDFCLELGKIFARGNNYRQALQQFHRALDLKPDSLATKMWIAFTYSRAQRPDQVLEWVVNIRAASHQEPLKPSDELELLRMEAWAHLLKGEFEQGEKILTDAQRKSPANDTLLAALMQYYLASGRATNALESVNSQLATRSDDKRALLHKGVLHIHLKQHSEAVPPLTRLIELEPENKVAILYRATAHLELDDLEAAEKDYQELKRIAPDSFIAYYGLGEIAQRRNDTRTALLNFELYLEKAPPDAPDNERITRLVEELKGR